MTKEEFYDRGIVKINEIYQIFKDHFTEDRVDLRNILPKETFCNKCINLGNDNYNLNEEESPYIIVHFPEVTITNEYNDSVTIKDLWAKIALTFKGTLRHGFLLNRSHYPASHWYSDYMHSHISGIPKNRISDFLSPCLGSGPIRDTISSLISEYDELLWQLFCRELEVYVGVESLEGVPYRRISSIGNSNYINLITDNRFHHNIYYNYTNNSLSYPLLEKFIKYVIDSKILKFNFNCNSYSIAMSPLEYYINISNLFIEWYNKAFENKEVTVTYPNLITKNILITVNIINNKIYHSRIPVIRDERGGDTVLTFKNKPIKLVIEDDQEERIECNHILNINIATSILRSILLIVNYKYGREENRNSEGAESITGTQYRFIL